MLETAQTNKWPDPVQEDFEKKYAVEFARAKAYGEIQTVLESAESSIRSITKQIKDPEKNYAL